MLKRVPSLAVMVVDVEDCEKALFPTRVTATRSVGIDAPYPIFGSRAVFCRRCRASAQGRRRQPPLPLHPARRALFVQTIMQFFSRLKHAGFARSVFAARPPHAPAPRFFTSTTFRQASRRYVRFGGDPKRPFDISKWDMPTKLFAGVGLGCGVYYVTQCVAFPPDNSWCSCSHPCALFAALNRFPRRGGGGLWMLVHGLSRG